MSEKCRQWLTAAEKPELWHRWQPGILKAIRRAFGKRYAGVASIGWAGNPRRTHWAILSARWRAMGSRWIWTIQAWDR